MKKLNVWDSSVLASNYNVANQALAKLAIICSNIEGDVNLKDLPPSMFPTEALYNLCIAYTVIYDTLVEHQLLNTGNKKPTNQIH